MGRLGALFSNETSLISIDATRRLEMKGFSHLLICCCKEMQGIPKESAVWLSQAVCVGSILVFHPALCQLLRAEQCPWNRSMAVIL